MEIEDVTRVRLAPRRPSQNQRQLAVRLRLLGEIVVHDQRVLALPHEVLGQRGRGVRSDVLHRRGVGRVGGHDDRVLHRAVLAERLDDAADLTGALPDRAVDADDVGVFLVDDRVDGDGRLARATIADDQLALTTPDRNHRVDGLDPRLHRLADRLTLHDTGSHDVDLPRTLDPVDRSVAVLRGPERIHDPAQVAGADRDVEHAARAADLVTLVQAGPVTHDDRTDVVLFEVQRERGHGVTRGGGRDLEHLRRHRLRQAIDAGDSVSYLENFTDLLRLELVFVPLDLVEQDVLDLAGAELGVVGHLYLVLMVVIEFRRLRRRRRRGVGPGAVADACHRGVVVPIRRRSCHPCVR